MKQEIKKFRKETGGDLVIKDSKPFYGGSLYLRGTGITALPDNLTVGDYLDLENCTGITALPDNLTVGGSLDLENCTGITALPDNLTVGGSLYLRGTGITGEVKVNKKLSSKAIATISRVSNMPIFWEWNDRNYIKVDDMFTAIDSHHGNVYRVHKLNSSEQLYLVTDSENHWAHGRTLQEARADLIFKINDRDTSVYRNMSLNDTITYEEAIAAYRTITGACAAGTRDFIENRLPKPHKDKYTVQEIIALTEKEYGGKKFSEFFNSNK